MEFFIGLIIGAGLTWYIIVRPGRKSLAELKKQYQDNEVKQAKAKAIIEVLEKAEAEKPKKE